MTEPCWQSPGGEETSTTSPGSQNLCVTIWTPSLLTFSVGTISKTPGLWRLVIHRSSFRVARGSDLGILASSMHSGIVTGLGDSSRTPRGRGVVIILV